MGQSPEFLFDPPPGKASLLRGFLARCREAFSPAVRDRLAESYQPMLRAILVPVAIFYCVMAVAHYIDEASETVLFYGALRLTIAAVALAIAVELGRRKLSFFALEIRTAALFFAIYGLMVIQQIRTPNDDKLIFFLLHAVVNATVSVSARFALAGMALEVATMVWFASQYGPGTQAQFSFIGVTGALVGVCMALLTRSAIKREIQARMASDRARSDAEHIADHDMLTDLPNRRAFLRMLEARFKKRKGKAPAFAMAIIDLDGFKAVNDGFGHAIGDAVLVETGRRLKNACEREKVLARLGGDEFGVLIDGPIDTDALPALGARMRELISRPYEIMGIRLTLGASVGFVPEQIAIFTGSEMFERADYAMFRARTEKRGVVVFTPELEMDRRINAAVEHNLRHCDRESEMHVVFQPQVDLESGRTVGFEALARWDNRELGTVAPDMFIRAAERIGVIDELTALFLVKALAHARDWPAPLTLSFNLSIRDILLPRSIETICRIVSESGFPPERIEFEVTENLIIADMERAEESLRMLHALGARVALDDFGVGYANFGHIDQLNIHTIKIDRSFVKRLTDSAATVKVVKTMIDMCANLEVASIVEGVETAEEVAILRQIGARYVQGYLFGRPMAGTEIPLHLARELATSLAGAREMAAQAG